VHNNEHRFSVTACAFCHVSLTARLVGEEDEKECEFIRSHVCFFGERHL
jgi:hypothetical protein